MKVTMEYIFARNGKPLKIGEPIKFDPREDDHRMCKVAIYAGAPVIHMYIQRNGDPCNSIYGIVNHMSMFHDLGITFAIRPDWIEYED